jgi:hypothetical protein
MDATTQLDSANHRRMVRVVYGDQTYEFAWGTDVSEDTATREAILLVEDLKARTAPQNP